jgi:hypothetical protein
LFTQILDTHVEAFFSLIISADSGSAYLMGRRLDDFGTLP